ncbi:MAG TPA: ATPase, T2SS/T4P/T4SS family [Acetobacterium sp.]
MKENKLVLEMLLKNKEITRQDIALRIPKAQRAGVSVLDVLLQDRIIAPEKLLLIFHKEWGFEVYDPNRDLMDPRSLSLITQEQAVEFTIFPLNQSDGGSLILLMADPTDEEAIRSLQQIAKKRLKILVTEKHCILRLIHKYYNQNPVSEEKALYKVGQTNSINEEHSIVALVNKIIEEGVSRGASDIHIEAYSEKIQVRIRIDGLLQPLMRLDEETWRGLVTRLKILGECDIAEHRLPQDGAFTTRVEGRQIDLRLSLLPPLTVKKLCCDYWISINF